MDILVYESDESLRDLFAYILEGKENHIFFASNLNEAFKLLSDRPFQRIYTDLDSDSDMAYLLVSSAVYQGSKAKVCFFNREVLIECLDRISRN